MRQASLFKGECGICVSLIHPAYNRRGMQLPRARVATAPEAS